VLVSQRLPAPQLNTPPSPFACPECRTGVGLPRSVISKGADAVVIRLDCQQCRHSWKVIRTIREGVPTFEPEASDPTPSAQND
jgi:hypothetical protein